MTAITLIVPVKPNGKQRPRVGKGGHIYSPEDVNGFAERVQVAARMAHVERAEGPVALTITVHRRIAQNVKGKRREAMLGTFAVGRPDFYNVAKSVADALNGIAYHDDAQVARGVVNRFWADADEVVISIEEVTE